MFNFKELESILERAELELYVCDWAPNGTNDVLLYSTTNGEIIDSVPELTFGIDVVAKDPEEQLVVHAYYDFISTAEIWPTVADSSLLTYVRPVNLSDVVSRIAISPVTTEQSQLERLVSAIKEAV